MKAAISQQLPNFVALALGGQTCKRGQPSITIAAIRPELFYEVRVLVPKPLERPGRRLHSTNERLDEPGDRRGHDRHYLATRR